MRIFASDWLAERPDFAPEAWALVRKTNIETKTFLSKREVRETMQSERPDSEDNFVLGPAPAWQNVQTLSLEPGPG